MKILGRNADDSRGYGANQYSSPKIKLSNVKVQYRDWGYYYEFKDEYEPHIQEQVVIKIQKNRNPVAEDFFQPENQI